MEILIRILTSVLRDSRHRKQWRIFSTVMAAVVVFVTTYSLILPAITLEENAARVMDGVSLEQGSQSVVENEVGYEDLQVVSDDSDHSDTAVVSDDGNGADGQQAPLIDASAADGQQSGDIMDGIIKEETEEARKKAARDPEAGAAYAEGSLTASGVLLNDEGGLDEIRLSYGADAMIPEGTVCIAKPFAADPGKESPEAKDELAQRYEQAVREMVAEEHPDWTNVEVRMFDLKLKKNDTPVAAQKKLDVELTAAQPITCAHAALLHFKNNDPQDELQKIAAEEIENAGSVHIDPPVEMKKAQIERDENDRVSLIRCAAKKLNVFALVTADAASEEVSAQSDEISAPAETEADGSSTGRQSETEAAAGTGDGNEAEAVSESETGSEAGVETETGRETESEAGAKAETESEFAEERIEGETASAEDIETETEFEEETEAESFYPAQEFSAKTDTVDVYIFAPQGAFPEGTTMEIADVDDDETIAAISDAAATDQSVVQRVQAVDISFRDAAGTEIEPQIPIRVEITAQEKQENENAVVVHVDNDGNAQTVEIAAPITQELAGIGAAGETVAFDADAFSVYAIVYTVDFHWEVNGMEYVFNLPGGGYVSFEALLEVLGVADSADAKAQEEMEVVPDDDPAGASDQPEAQQDTPAGASENDPAESVPAESASTDNAPAEGNLMEESGEEPAGPAVQAPVALTLNDIPISEATKEFAAGVERVEFSAPELLWVGKIQEDTTVGALKEANGLDVQYSAELTEEQIAEINAQTAKAGDWALISVLPFTSEESLTVTMKNGEQFVIRVTDAQDPSNFVGKEVIIYDNAEQRAMTSANAGSDGYRNSLKSVPVVEAEGSQAAHWIIESANGGYYIRSIDGKYLRISGTGNTDISLVNKGEATILDIQPGDNPDYRISAANNYNAVLTYEPNDKYDGFFSTPGGTYSGDSGTNRWLYIREVQKVTEKAGDWLLYFDDDFDEITIHVGETITLRPYNKWEWKEGNIVVQSAHWNVGGSAWNDWSISDSDANGSKLTNATDGPFKFTRYVKYDDQLETRYWSVQGQATKTGDYTLRNTKNGKTITVHVVDGAPVSEPNTINRIANIKVNLFDYDNGGKLDEGLVGGVANHNLANDSNFKNESVNQMGGADHFYFLSSGSGTSGTENWNNYTKDASNPNIVKDTLDSEGYPVLNHGNNTSLKYLFDKSQTSWHGGGGNGMIAYPDVVGMFQKDNDGYYYFNSNTNYYYYDTASGTSKLYEHTYTQSSGTDKNSLVNDKPIGFFPFHPYNSTDDLYVNQNKNLNHHVGMSMEMEFMLPKDKKDDQGKPIIFDFSGDDDLWVFVEWTDDNGQKHSRRLLDLGGVHQPIHGQINFTNGSNTEFMETNRPYTLKVFYLERGGCDSNCSIRFNLPIIQDLAVSKKLTGLTEAEKAKYKDEEFTYEIIVNGQPYNYPNPNNKYEKATLHNAAGADITPADFKIKNGRFTLRDGQTLTITYLDRSDKFSVAEVKTANMENFEVPNAERYYHQSHDASLYEEEIHLTAGQTQAEPHTDCWTTPKDKPYELEDTEKVTFTNTLKEKNLEVEKKWKGEKDHPDSITFTVSATIDDGNGGRIPYSVDELKEPDGSGGTKDKVFTLSGSSNWREEIEHLPVNTPDGKFIFYDISEGVVEGYTLTGLRDITAENYNYCNVDVVKLWPDSNGAHTEVIEVVLQNAGEKYYAGTGADGNAVFVDNISDAETFSLTADNNYTHRVERVPAGTYTAVQLHEDAHAKGLATYVHNIIQYELENSPIEGPVGPEVKPNTPVIHKRIDALRDGAENPDSPHAGEDLTDLYRLYLDYKINSLQEAAGVDLLFVIDHSGSMNNREWQGNPYRAPAVEAALNGENGLISEFLAMNDRNQWAAVGFKGPDGAENYYWSMGNPWEPATELSKYNAGQNGSEVLSPGGTNYEFTRADASPSGKNVALDDEGPNILTNYTAGLWRAEQFLLKQDVKEDGRKKVIVFISDGIPTLHIDCSGGTLQGAGTANGSPYYRDAYGGCPNQTLTEFGYFVNDMTGGGYTFGENLEFYTIGFGGTMQTDAGEQLLTGMLDRAYGQGNHSGHYMTISDSYYNPRYEPDYSEAAETLENDLRTIMGMNETFTDLVIQDDLSGYVDLYGIADAGADAAAVMRAAKAKVTMKIPDPDDPDKTKTVTLYENGAPVNSDDAKFTRADGSTKVSIIKELRYDASEKTVQAVFDPEYQAEAGAVYTLSFDVKATDAAYTKYAADGYKYTSGENQGQIITGDPDTDFLGTDPDNATSSGKPGFRSNDEAKAIYEHNNKAEELEYPHPVIQVAVKADIVKIDQAGAALEGAKFNLYDSRYDAGKTAAENAGCLIEADLQSKKPADPAGDDAVIRSGKLASGTYYLVETEAPGGYTPLPGPVKITVTETNGNLHMAAEIAGKAVPANMLVRTGKGTWKLSVQNSLGIELPAAGGPGTAPFTIAGSLLLLGAVILLRRRRRMV